MNLTKTVKRAVCAGLSALFLFSTAAMAATGGVGYITGTDRFQSTDIAQNADLRAKFIQEVNANGIASLIVDTGNGIAANYNAFMATDTNHNLGWSDLVNFAQAHTATIPYGTQINNPDGTKTPDPNAQQTTPSGITVSAITAITKTTVTVKLSAVPTTTPSAADFNVAGNTVAGLVKGSTDDVYTLTLGTSLDGKSGTLTVNGVSQTYNFTTAGAKATTESVTFVNYRELQVTFSTVVDHVTATNPANYYFEIAEGDASLGLDANGILNKGLNLSELNPWFSDPANIFATDVNGKTVVTIKLPENDRFTSWTEPDGLFDPAKYGVRTLGAELANADKDGSLVKYFEKDSTVYVSVRNVREASGVMDIDTCYLPMHILDTTSPTLVTANKVTSDNTETPFSLTSGVTLTSDGSDKVNLVYSEPVYDAHDWDASGTDRDVKLYIDGKLVGDSHTKKTAPFDSVGGLYDNESVALNQVMTFDMSATATYDSSCRAYIDVKTAVEDAVGTKIGYQAGHTYNVKVVGVTDLAGNIQVPNTVEFNVTVVDPTANYVKPAILGIKQVGDNMFRIEANEENVTGLFTIANADGEGGTVTQYMPLTTPSDGHFYSYIDVPVTVDGEPERVDKHQQDNLLDYDGQDFIYRDLKVSNVQWVKGEFNVLPKTSIFNNDTGYEALAFGDNYDTGMMELQKDIYAPVAIHPTGTIAYNTTTQLKFGVTDVVPQGTESSYANPVSIMKYVYKPYIKAFDQENLDLLTPDQPGYERYLPIKVSYVDQTGATHGVLVTNLTVNDTNEHKTITGAPNSISYDGSNLTIDLSSYPDMLDPVTHKLVPGVTYTVEVPKGYFADPALELKTETANSEKDSQDFMAATNASPFKIIKLADWETGLDHHIRIDREFENVYDVLYVAEARSLCHGYTSIADTLNFATDPVPAAIEAVPQTSKELIQFNNPPDVISVEFTGQIKVSTLKDPNNYTLNGKTLAQLGVTPDDITYVVNGQGTVDPTDDRQFAIINLPADTVAADGDAQFTVSGVTNNAGGMMTPVTTQIALLDNTRPVATTVQVTAQRQIKLTFGEPIQYKAGSNGDDAAKNFVVMCNGQQLTVLEATLDPSKDDRMVTLDLGTDIPSTGAITVQVVKNSNNNDIVIQDETKNHNPLNSDLTYTATR